jgi:hypothetical protein
MEIVIIATPLADKPGRFEARLADGKLLCASTRQPLLDGARELLKHGIDPKAQIVMRHYNSTVDALRSTIGVAAKLTVKEEPNVRFGKWEETEEIKKRTHHSSRG